MKRLLFILLACITAGSASAQRTERSYDATFFRVGDYVIHPCNADSLFQYDATLPGSMAYGFHEQLGDWTTFMEIHPDLYFGIGLFTKTNAKLVPQNENTLLFARMAAEIPFLRSDSLLAEHYRPLVPTDEITQALSAKPDGCYLVTQITDIRYLALKRTPAFFGFEDQQKGFLFRGVPNVLVPLWPDSIRAYTFTGYGCELQFNGQRNLVVTPGENRVCRIEVSTADGSVVYERTFHVSNVPDPVLFFAGLDLQAADPTGYSSSEITPDYRFAVHARNDAPLLRRFDYTVLSATITVNGKPLTIDGGYLPDAVSRRLNTAPRSTLEVRTVTVRFPDQRIETYTVDQMLYFTAKKGRLTYSRNKRFV